MGPATRADSKDKPLQALGIGAAAPAVSAN